MSTTKSELASALAQLPWANGSIWFLFFIAFDAYFLWFTWIWGWWKRLLQFLRLRHHYRRLEGNSRRLADSKLAALKRGRSSSDLQQPGKGQRGRERERVTYKIMLSAIFYGDSNVISISPVPELSFGAYCFSSTFISAGLAMPREKCLPLLPLFSASLAPNKTHKRRGAMWGVRGDARPMWGWMWGVEVRLCARKTRKQRAQSVPFPLSLFLPIYFYC